ncbi:hypothetical protein L9F63_014859, partial [Diploptera punctata]
SHLRHRRFLRGFFYQLRNSCYFTPCFTRRTQCFPMIPSQLRVLSLYNALYRVKGSFLIERWTIFVSFYISCTIN